MPALARQVYARLDAEWQRAAQEYERQTGEKLPCGPGCADCCKASNEETPFVSIAMRRAEAALLEETLAALPPTTQDLLAERVLGNYSATCLLLSPDQRCLIYEGRPLWCRIFGLPGIMSCDEVPALRGDWVERWVEAVYEARQAFVGNGLTLSGTLIRRWADDRIPTRSPDHQG